MGGQNSRGREQTSVLGLYAFAGKRALWNVMGTQSLPSRATRNTCVDCIVKRTFFSLEFDYYVGEMMDSMFVSMIKGD